MPVVPITFTADTSTGDYIVVITNRDSQGKLIGNHVYQATAFAILPLNPDINVQSPPHPVEAHLLKLLRAHLDSGIFLFSYEYDVTRRMQVQWQHHNRDADKGMWEVVCTPRSVNLTSC